MQNLNRNNKPSTIFSLPLHNILNTWRKTWNNFTERGAVAESSRFLANKMIDPIVNRDNLVVIELGAGGGSITNAILRKMPSSGRLLAIEINPIIAEHLRQNIMDKRLTVVSGNAANLSKILRDMSIESADYVISGLPLGNFGKQLVETVLQEIRTCLKDGGSYVQFQYFLANFRDIKKEFPSQSISFVPLNIPPAFVITSKKT